MAKLANTINNKPIPFEVDGTALWAKRLTVKEVQSLQKDLKEIQNGLNEGLVKRAEDLSVELTKEEEDKLMELNGALVMYLFRNVIVGDDGTLFEEFIDPAVTYADACEYLPVSLLQQLPEAVMATISGHNSGN